MDNHAVIIHVSHDQTDQRGWIKTIGCMKNLETPYVDWASVLQINCKGNRKSKGN